MGKLVVGAFLTLDGVMQGPGRPEEDRSGGFESGGWSFSYWDEAMGRVITESLAHTDALLLGRRTYEIFAGYWPQVTDPGNAVAVALNTKPKYVVSRTMQRADWANTTVLSGDPAEAVKDLKQQIPGVIQVQGSPELIQALLAGDLVDEFRLWVFPVVVGSGKRLFGRGTLPRGLRLTASTISSTGVAILTYQAAGSIEYGTIGSTPEGTPTSA